MKFPFSGAKVLTGPDSNDFHHTLDVTVSSIVISRNVPRTVFILSRRCPATGVAGVGASVAIAIVAAGASAGAIAII